MKRPEETIAHPPLLRLILFVGRPLGVAFVPQQHVQVIYHMGKYAGCKGPGLIYHSRLTETLGPLVFVSGQRHEYEFENVISRDVLAVTIHVSTSVMYDPVAGHQMAPVLTHVPREAYVSIAGTYIRWSLLAAANQYNASELTQAEVRAQLEQAVHEQVNRELQFLGLQLSGKLRIVSVELPDSLTERHEAIAQRRANILAGAEFHPAEYRRALVSEVLEHLAQGAGGESLVNFGEMLEAYAADKTSDPALGRSGNPPRIIEQPPRGLEDKQAARPEAPPTAAEDKPPAPRPKSRL